MNRIKKSGIQQTNPPLKIDWTRNFSLNDPQRSKAIPLRVTYPLVPGSYPIVIFSHGAGNSKEGYRFLIRHWTRAGYICLQPTHDDSVDLLRLKYTVSDYMALAIQCAGNAVYWKSRVDDLNLIIASLKTIAAQLPAGVLFDEQKIVIAGHSFGAFTAQLLAGATPNIPAGVIPGMSGPTSFANRLPKGFLLFSPQGVNTPGLGMPNKAAWAAMTPPSMVLTGSLDTGLQGQPARWRTEPFLHSPAGDKYLVFVDGAHHMTCAEKPSSHSAPQNPDRFSFMAQASLNFLDAYAKNDPGAKQSLLNHDVEKASSGVVKQSDR